jgi:hypothetical protein
LQGVQALWDLPRQGYSWATAGYMGAISSGHATCGLLIGPTTAIGLKCGQGTEGAPEEHEEERNRAVKAVARLYRDFVKEFGSTDCTTLAGIDFSDPKAVERYVNERLWKNTCDRFLRFVMERCAQMADEGRI